MKYEHAELPRETLLEDAEAVWKRTSSGVLFRNDFIKRLPTFSN